MKFTVVIPTLNEAGRIEATLASVRAPADPFEVIVADGGSTDDTCRIAEEGGARIVTAPSGRAVQMNAGAACAGGDVLLFLHADTLLPPGAFDLIRSAFANSAVEAGAFRLAFDRWTPLLRFYSLCTRLHRPSLCFGDRGLFVRRATFEALGGFAPLPLFEDLDLVHRLWQRGGFVFLSASVTTSARRFERQGPLQQQLRNTYLWMNYMLGRDPERLRHLYPYSPDERG